jgi:hypothetical protein
LKRILKSMGPLTGLTFTIRQVVCAINQSILFKISMARNTTMGSSCLMY